MAESAYRPIPFRVSSNDNDYGLKASFFTMIGWTCVGTGGIHFRLASRVCVFVNTGSHDQKLLARSPRYVQVPCLSGLAADGVCRRPSDDAGFLDPVRLVEGGWRLA